MHFVVVIPVINHDLAYGLLGSIDNNSLLPKKVIIIDNADEQFNFNSSRYEVVTIRVGRRLKVNESWNLGIILSGECDAVSILNDDILLNKDFFKRTERVLKQESVGVSSPFTVIDKRLLKRFWLHNYDIIDVKKREGWAFTVRKDVLDRIPEIPCDILETFGGDDWIYHWVKKNGKKWRCDLLNYVWHKGGVSVGKFNLKRDCKREKRLFIDYIKQLEGAK